MPHTDNLFETRKSGESGHGGLDIFSAREFRWSGLGCRDVRTDGAQAEQARFFVCGGAGQFGLRGGEDNAVILSEHATGV